MFIVSIEHASVSKLALVSEDHVGEKGRILLQTEHNTSTKCYSLFSIFWMRHLGYVNFEGTIFLFFFKTLQTDW